MRINELFRQKKPISFEIFPPKGELSMDSFRTTLDALSRLHPDFISVTCSAGGSGGRDRTAALAGIIRREYGIEACAHLTCVNSTAQMLAEDVAKLHEEKVENVLALRGDVIPDAPGRVFRFASELMTHLQGEGFCLSGACYPEGHIECDDPAQDLVHLREKQQAGASYFVSQLFFDNACFFRFLENARKIGVTVPITAGVMPILSQAQIQRMIFTCGASLPSDIIRILNRYADDPDGLRQAGIEYAARQIRGLLEGGADGVHVYTMNRPQIATGILELLK